MSVYRTARKKAKPIYGARCDVPDCPSLGPLFGDYLDMAEAMRRVISIAFPTVAIKAPLVAKMTATASVSITVFVRLQWRKRYVGIEFIGSEEQKSQLKYIYLENGYDWRGDKYLNPPVDIVPLPGYCV